MSADDIAAWIERLYLTAEGWLVAFSQERHHNTPRNYIDSAPVADYQQLAQTLERRADTCCVWLGVATRKQKPELGRRGGTADCLQIPGLWLDIDIAGDAHASDQLPTSQDQALELLGAYPLPASAVINSGHGLQAWWLFDEPLAANDATELLARWAATWQHHADHRGLHLDNVFDLPRIMRVPGTFNRKTEPARPVTVKKLSNTHTTYTPCDLDEWLIDAPTPTPPPARQPKATGPTDALDQATMQPGDDFNDRTTCTQILEDAGWIQHRTTSNGDRYYTRPGKDPRTGHSAVVYANNGKVSFWSDAPELGGAPTRENMSPFYLYAWLNHAGDTSAAARQLRQDGYGSVARNDAFTGSENTTKQGNNPAPTTEPLKIRWTDTYTTQPPDDRPWLVHGLIRQGEFTVIVAERGVGKTWAGYNLAYNLAKGQGEFLGRLKIDRPSSVLYLQGELDEYSAGKRWQKLAGLTDDIPRVAEVFDRTRIRVLEVKMHTIGTDGRTYTESLTRGRVDKNLADLILTGDFDVIIIDPWAVYYGGQENSNDAAEAALAELRGLTQKIGATFVIFHHVGKTSDVREPEDLWRGASRLADWAANRVTMMRHYSTAKAKKLGMKRHEARRYVDLHFLRRGEPLEDYSIELAADGWWRQWEPPEGDDDDDQGAGRRPAITTRELLSALDAAGGEWQSYNDAAKALGVANDTAKRAIDKAVGAGAITLTAGKNRATIITSTGLEIDRPKFATQFATQVTNNYREPEEHQLEGQKSQVRDSSYQQYREPEETPGQDWFAVSNNSHTTYVGSDPTVGTPHADTEAPADIGDDDMCGLI